MKHYEFPVLPGHYGCAACNRHKFTLRIELTRRTDRIECGNCKRTDAFQRGCVRRERRRATSPAHLLRTG